MPVVDGNWYMFTYTTSASPEWQRQEYLRTMQSQYGLQGFPELTKGNNPGLVVGGTPFKTYEEQSYWVQYGPDAWKTKYVDAPATSSSGSTVGVAPKTYTSVGSSVGSSSSSGYSYKPPSYSSPIPSISSEPVKSAPIVIAPPSLPKINTSRISRPSTPVVSKPSGFDFFNKRGSHTYQPIGRESHRSTDFKSGINARSNMSNLFSVQSVDLPDRSLLGSNNDNSESMSSMFSSKKKRYDDEEENFFGFFGSKNKNNKKQRLF